jgi:hypothetical protein
MHYLQRLSTVLTLFTDPPPAYTLWQPTPAQVRRYRHLARIILEERQHFLAVGVMASILDETLLLDTCRMDPFQRPIAQGTRAQLLARMRWGKSIATTMTISPAFIHTMKTGLFQMRKYVCDTEVPNVVRVLLLHSITETPVNPLLWPYEPFLEAQAWHGLSAPSLSILSAHNVAIKHIHENMTFALRAKSAVAWLGAPEMPEKQVMRCDGLGYVDLRNPKEVVIPMRKKGDHYAWTH